MVDVALQQPDTGGLFSEEVISEELLGLASHDLLNLKQERGLVQSDRTISSSPFDLFNTLIFQHKRNNILIKWRETREEIVQQFWTILRPGSESSRIVNIIAEARVFTAKELIKETGLPRSTVYELLDLLKREQVVTESNIEAVKPDPRRPGPKARFITYGPVEVLTWEDPLLRRAQAAYEATFTPRPEAENPPEPRLIDISTAVADYYRARGMTGSATPDISRVITHLKDSHPEVEPRDRQRIAHQTIKRLREAKT